MKILILAGGGGTRLWPLSRQDVPKQFLSFGSLDSLLQLTVKRFLNSSLAEEIVVLTNFHYEELVSSQLAKIDPTQRVQILVEPIRRNSAAAIALGIKYLQEKRSCRSDDAILVIPSDHLLQPEIVFLRLVEEVEKFIRKGNLILFGIRPNKPESGYGYIQIGAEDRGPLYHIKRFIEKPDRSRAESYLSSGDYYWNSGMVAFSPETFWRETKAHAPAIYQTMQGDFNDCLSRFAENPDVSIDYAVLEKTKIATLCPMPISWSDVGCWDSVYDVLDKDENLNVKIGNVLEIDTKGSLIFGNKKIVSTIGLEDVIIVATDDATFIGKKGESQKVKNLVEALVRADRKDLGSQYAWGNVKLLYKSNEYEIFSYQISPSNGFSFSSPKHGTTNWIVLKGDIQIGDSLYYRHDSISFSASEEKYFKNLTDKTSELLMVQVSLDPTMGFSNSLSKNLFKI